MLLSTANGLVLNCGSFSSLITDLHLYDINEKETENQLDLRKKKKKSAGNNRNLLLYHKDHKEENNKLFSLIYKHTTGSNMFSIP